MLSRLAGNLYWFARYLRRAENTARLINVNASLTLDLPRELPLGWAPLVEILGATDAFRALYPLSGEEEVVRFLAVDERNPSSIRASLERAREILRVSRETVPREVWERLNDVYIYVQERGDNALLRPFRQEFLSRVISTAIMIYGLLNANTSRDVGFQFLRVGSAIEQADMTSRILDVRAGLVAPNTPEARALANVQWISVLRSLTAYQMYRRHVRARINALGVLRFLLQDREFPRSVAFCLAATAGTLPYLPSHRRIERTLERSRALVRDADVGALLGVPAGIARLMDEIQIGLANLHAAFSEAYFLG